MGCAPAVLLRIVPCHMAQLWEAHNDGTTSCGDCSGGLLFLQISFMPKDRQYRGTKWIRGKAWLETQVLSQVETHKAACPWHAFWGTQMSLCGAVSTATATMPHSKTPYSTAVSALIKLQSWGLHIAAYEVAPQDTEVVSLKENFTAYYSCHY